MVEPREGKSSDAAIDRRESPTTRAVDARATELKAEKGDDHPELEDDEAARRAARSILEDSEARTQEAADLGPEDDVVIRRTSTETARDVR